MTCIYIIYTYVNILTTTILVIIKIFQQGGTVIYVCLLHPMLEGVVFNVITWVRSQVYRHSRRACMNLLIKSWCDWVNVRVRRADFKFIARNVAAARHTAVCCFAMATMLQPRPRAPLMSDIPINIHVCIYFTKCELIEYITYKCPPVWVNTNRQMFNTLLKKVGLFRPMKASNICSAKPTFLS
jgi:hypothetical protein